MSEALRWIAADWGTSRLRIWGMGAGRGADAALFARASDQGMARLAPGDYPAALTALLGDQAPGPGALLPVVVCGMAGAAGGWAEAGYGALPWDAGQGAGSGFVRPDAGGDRFAPVILPGLAQTDPPDVMRGEETQIAGFIAANPGFTGTLILPGTHSKWVTLDRGLVRGFRSFMTGEVFAALTGATILRLTMPSDAPPDDASDETFLGAVAAALDDPHLPLSDLFSLRAGALLGHDPAPQGRARLSGWLIGAEIAAARRAFDLGSPIALIGAGDLGARYRSALALAEIKAPLFDGEALVLDGLCAAYRNIFDGDPA
ncbi:MAG: 2-dehydro-3-deoxygalactonokinase [Paracoccus sp. (in: a-proteobacteria)]|nr:2-dehydro-3-deoxygalactonokinase [Paracoccus sp. (in: a-proteobacteria)]